eukprot:GGOE01060127.1.p1 GENE.GGOE01060127.1~~GGOE01060127.1.p1  ORF type:complete len:449 (-),score=106.41 GGOE01060127.1:450-1796(-)
MSTQDITFLRNHQVPEMINSLTEELLNDRPKDIYVWLMNWATNKVSSRAASPPGLKQSTVDIVKQTAPVLQEHGVSIVCRFYEQLFQKIPALKGVFNMTHQMKDGAGSAPQHRALAAAVCAYAENIDNLGALTGAVQRIAHKHVSVGVVPEQYPIVGEKLLLAIKAVLGEAATPAIIDAWAEAYSALAKVFIDAEEGLYKELETRPGGWRGWRAFKVARCEPESATMKSFYLEPMDGKGVCPYSAGQYTCLRLKIPGQEYPVLRNYTISSAFAGKHLRITVKKEGDGLASRYLHNEVSVGTVLEVAPPAGVLTADVADRRPLVLVSAGVGITPMFSLLQEAVEASNSSRRIFFIHGARSLSQHPFKSEVAAITAEKHSVSCHYFYSQEVVSGVEKGRITPKAILDISNGKDCCFFLCGPAAFLKEISEGLVAAGVSSGDVHFEAFGPQ